MSREIIIGDIHGCYDEFLELLKKIQPQEEDQIIALGDIVDRGPKSVELYQYFKNTPNARIIMGNHERKHLRGILSYSQEIVKLQFGALYPEFREWLADKEYYYESEHAIIVHASLVDGIPLEEQRENVLSGTMSGGKYLQRLYGEQYWSEVYSGEKPIIYGHHVVGERPEVINDKVYGIDTGACHGGRLTAIVLPGFEIHQVDVKYDYWREQQIIWQIPVLKNKNWNNCSFELLRQEIRYLKKKREKPARQFTEALEKWVGKLEQLKLSLANHGRFGREEITKRCPTPHKLLQLAAELDIEAQLIPGPFHFEQISVAPVVMRTLPFQVPDVKFEDLHIPDPVKSELNHLLAELRSSEDEDEPGHKPLSRVLMVGSKDSNGVQLARAIAGEAKLRLIELDGKQLRQEEYAPYTLTAIFKKARREGACAVVLNNVEAITNNEEPIDQWQRALWTQELRDPLVELVEALDELNDEPEMLFIAITKQKDSMKQALLQPGRIDLTIDINEVSGNLPQTKEPAISEESKQRLAFHVAGLVLASHFLEEAPRLNKAVLQFHGIAPMGYVKYAVKEEIGHLPEAMLGEMSLLWSGHIAQELTMSDAPQFSKANLDQLQRIAWDTVHRKLPHDHAVPKRELKRQIEQLKRESHSRARALLIDKMRQLKQIKEAILEKGSLSKAEVGALVGE